MRAIAFVHHKGGTGKTTSCLNVGGWLVKMGKHVLVVDLDPQGNATAGLGVDRSTVDGSVYDVLRRQKDMRDVILETGCGVCLAPSALRLLALETRMGGQSSNARGLRDGLGSVADHFDYVLIDVPPGSSPLIINGIVAAENVIIPLDSGVFAYEAMETLKALVVGLDQELGIETNVMMVLLREHSSSVFGNGPTREIKELLEEFLAASGIPGVKVFTIPFSRKMHRAQMKGMPISQDAPRSSIGRGVQESGEGSDELLRPADRAAGRQ